MTSHDANTINRIQIRLGVTAAELAELLETNERRVLSWVTQGPQSGPSPIQWERLGLFWLATERTPALGSVQRGISRVLREGAQLAGEPATARSRDELVELARWMLLDAALR